MPSSFFERLTGSVRAHEGSEPKAAEPSRRGRSRAVETGERKQVLHPVGEGEAALAPPEAGEEGELTVDIFDDGSNIVIQSTVAGVKPEDIDISLQDDTLTIRGSRRRGQEVNEENFFYRELYWGAFSRSIILPEEVEFSKADAVIKNGLLTVKLPKKDKGEKKIRVKVGD